MKKWLLGIVIVVLLAGSGTNTYFYIQQNNRLNQVDERISGLLTNINSVQNGLTSLQGNVSTLGDSVSSLSTNVGTLGGKITDSGRYHFRPEQRRKHAQGQYHNH